MVFSHDSGVSPVLESSCMSYTLRFCVRCFLALARKSSFFEAPINWSEPAGSLFEALVTEKLPVLVVLYIDVVDQPVP